MLCSCKDSARALPGHRFSDRDGSHAERHSLCDGFRSGRSSARSGRYRVPTGTERRPTRSQVVGRSDVKLRPGAKKLTAQAPLPSDTGPYNPRHDPWLRAPRLHNPAGLPGQMVGTAAGRRCGRFRAAGTRLGQLADGRPRAHRRGCSWYGRSHPCAGGPVMAGRRGQPGCGLRLGQCAIPTPPRSRCSGAPSGPAVQCPCGNRRVASP